MAVGGAIDLWLSHQSAVEPVGVLGERGRSKGK